MPTTEIVTTAYRGFSPYEHLSCQRPRQLQSLLEGVPTAEPIADERRRWPRADESWPLVVCPLDEFFVPRDVAADAESMSLSYDGISFRVASNKDCSFRLVNFYLATGRLAQAIMRPVRVARLPEEDRWSVAGPLVTKPMEPRRPG